MRPATCKMHCLASAPMSHDLLRLAGVSAMLGMGAVKLSFSSGAAGPSLLGVPLLFFMCGCVCCVSVTRSWCLTPRCCRPLPLPQSCQQPVRLFWMPPSPGLANEKGSACIAWKQPLLRCRRVGLAGTWCLVMSCMGKVCAAPAAGFASLHESIQ